MTDENNSLSTNTTPGFSLKPKLTGLVAKKAQASAQSGQAEVKVPTVLNMPDRIGIIFDDSGSMSQAQRSDAKEGCEEFLRSCAKDRTAVAIYPMNGEGLKLTMNLPAVAVFTKGIETSGGTPLVAKAELCVKENNLTRLIIFSDGMPDYDNIQNLIGAKIPVDTVYIPNAGGVQKEAEEFMQNLAKRTDGIYLRFERGKSSFRTAFKYLSPGLRYMLADKSFVAKLEGR